VRFAANSGTPAESIPQVYGFASQVVSGNLLDGSAGNRQCDGHRRTPANLALDLEITKINSLALSWTIVHPIDDKSPLYNFNYTDMVNAKMEALVFVKAFDEVFSNTVVQRFSYIVSEVVWGAKFRIMYHADPRHGTTVLDLDKLNDHEKVELLSPVITPQ